MSARATKDELASISEIVQAERTGKVPPHNLEAEASLIGAVLLDKEAIIKIADIVSPEDFYADRNGLIFTAIMDLYESRQPIDLLTLSNKLEEAGELELSLIHI